MTAAYHGHVSCVTLLLEVGAGPRLEEEGNTGYMSITGCLVKSNSPLCATELNIKNMESNETILTSLSWISTAPLLSSVPPSEIRQFQLLVLHFSFLPLG